MSQPVEHLVLTEAGLLALVDRSEQRTINARDWKERAQVLERELSNLRCDHSRLERQRDHQVEQYHRSLAAHRELLTKRAGKAKDLSALPDLPPTWDADAKRIKDGDDIPF